MGSQLCPGSAKDLIQELGEIEKGEKSYEVFFKSCFDFKENKLHQILVSESDEQLFLHLDHYQEAIRPHFPHRTPSTASLPPPPPSSQIQKENATVQIQFSDGSSYKGEVREGLPHGEGEETSAQGDHYKGSFNNGVKEGKGVYTFANSEQYEGEFKENAMWGFGVYRFSNGDAYEGEFRKNERFGKGKYIFSKKGKEQVQSFQGEYRNDLRDGGGKLTYVGYEMQGQWKNGLYELALHPSLIKQQ